MSTDFDFTGMTDGMRSNYISKPGVYDVTVDGFIVSEDLDDYSGKPYVEFSINTPDELTSRIRFYRPNDGDTEKVVEIKKQRMRDFLKNLGCDVDAVIGLDLLKSSVGRSVRALFKDREYIGFDKENGEKPEIKTITEYSFSYAPNAKEMVKESYLYAALSSEEQGRFDNLITDWKKSNEATTNDAPTMDNTTSDEKPVF